MRVNTTVALIVYIIIMCLLIAGIAHCSYKLHTLEESQFDYENEKYRYILSIVFLIIVAIIATGILIILN